MSFLYPSFLFALFAIVVPILIHFFSFKKHRTVYFSNVEFLKTIKKESKKRSRLKHILLLITRILTILFLVLTFAQPYIPQNNQQSISNNQTIGIYIDNSFSMNALSDKGELLEAARNKALEIIQAYNTGTKFKLFTNDLEVKHQNILNREQIIQQISQIKVSPQVISLSTIYEQFKLKNNTDGTEQNKTLYFISDFQKNITDTDKFINSDITCYFIPFTPKKANNLYIDSVWIEAPAHRLNKEEQLLVRIINSSSENYQNLPLKLFINENLKSITNFSIDAQKEVIAELNYTNIESGLHNGRLEISDYPITYDNIWYLNYEVKSNLRTLVIYNKNDVSSKQGLNYLSALLANDPYIKMDKVNVENIKVSQLPTYNTIFLTNLNHLSTGLLDQLSKTIENGSSIVIFPELKTDGQVYKALSNKFNIPSIVGIDTTTLQISQIEYRHPFYQNVFKRIEDNTDFPKVNQHLIFKNNIRSKELTLLSFSNQNRALSQSDYGNGNIWTFSFPLNNDAENFAKDIIFVPTIYNIVLNSTEQQKLSYKIGVNRYIDLNSQQNIDLTSTISIKSNDDSIEFIPSKRVIDQGIRLDLTQQIKKAGQYSVKANRKTISTLSFNYNRNESELNYYSIEELQNNIESQNLNKIIIIKNVEGNFAKTIEEINKGIQLWKWFLLLSILFLLIEIAISRFWK